MRIFEPLVVRKPAVSIVSLIVTGTPCNEPTSSPRSNATSAALACSIKSGASVTIAFNSGFKRAIRSRCASATSTGDTSRSRIIFAIVSSDFLYQFTHYFCAFCALCALFVHNSIALLRLINNLPDRDRLASMSKLIGKGVNSWLFV